MEVCTCKGSERLYNVRASPKGLGKKVENIRLLFLPCFMKTISIVSFSWFFPREIFPLLRAGKLLVLLGVRCCARLRPGLLHAALQQSGSPPCLVCVPRFPHITPLGESYLAGAKKS